MAPELSANNQIAGQTLLSFDPSRCCIYLLKSVYRGSLKTSKLHIHIESACQRRLFTEGAFHDET